MSTRTQTSSKTLDAFRAGSLDGAADAADGVYLPTWSNPWIDDSHGHKVLDLNLARAYADGYESAYVAIPARW